MKGWKSGFNKEEQEKPVLLYPSLEIKNKQDLKWRIKPLPYSAVSKYSDKTKTLASSVLSQSNKKR
jgi:hypothetical protein